MTKNVSPPAAPEDEGAGLSAWGRFRAWAARRKALLWWLHSFYALFLGFLVILFAQKGFDHARILAAILGGAFLVMVVLFRVFGEGRQQKERVEERTARKLQFLGMTYVLKNFYQGMLFFLLPFYWKSSTMDSMNAWFVILLGLLAFLSTMDLVFDNLLMRYKPVAAAFFGLTLFACANLVIPAFFRDVPALVSLLTSAALSVFGFWMLHVPFRVLRDKSTWIAIGLSLAFVVLAAWFGRGAMPPVPLYATHLGVGSQPMDDGRLKLEVTRVHRTLLTDLVAISEIAMPGGEGDAFKHVWRKKDADFRVETETRRVGAMGGEGADTGVRRVTSALGRDRLPEAVVGEWTVDTMTTDGQLVGRAVFEVLE